MSKRYVLPSESTHIPPSVPRHLGVVTKLMADKGFGFIQDAVSGTEYFFHRSALTANDWTGLSVQSRVTFNVGSSPKGLRAEDILPE